MPAGRAVYGARTAFAAERAICIDCCAALLANAAGHRQYLAIVVRYVRHHCRRSFAGQRVSGFFYSSISLVAAIPHIIISKRKKDPVE